MAPRGKPIKRRKKDSDDEEEADSDIEAVRAAASGRGGGSGRKQGQAKQTKHDKHDLNILLAQDDAEAFRQNVPCWASVRAGAPALPPRFFCCVCGCIATYKCSACFQHRPNSLTRYFCNSSCLSVHKETDCGKSRNLIAW
eukprot:GHVS01088148.1.p1 GENE.GHVS01088148.1~~GHVS01088148.1.p1  ORF type:complete len:141 (+),score=14.33 GHVS01088148.1:100-522(+)